MPTNLSGSNISDTFQQVLHTTGDGNMYDGTGSIFIPLSASHEITTELSSSHAEVADALTPGVDINVRSITASSAISSSFVGAHHLGPVKIQNGQLTLDTDGTGYSLSSADGILSVGHPSANFGTKFNNPITASGNISSSNGIVATNITASGQISAGTSTGYYLGDTKTLYASSGDVHMGNVGADTEIDGLTVTLNADSGLGGTSEIVLDASSGRVSIKNLPTSDPGVADRLWRDGTDLKISIG